METYSSILAWQIPWTEEPGGPQSLGSQRDLVTEHTHTHIHVHILTHMYTHMYIHIHYKHIYVCVYIYIYICIWYVYVFGGVGQAQKYPENCTGFMLWRGELFFLAVPLVRILVTQPRLNPVNSAGKVQSLTTGPLGNSLGKMNF